jgi:hypothetical protein
MAMDTITSRIKMKTHFRIFQQMLTAKLNLEILRQLPHQDFSTIKTKNINKKIISDKIKLLKNFPINSYFVYKLENNLCKIIKNDHSFKLKFLNYL